MDRQADGRTDRWRGRQTAGHGSPVALGSPGTPCARGWAALGRLWFHTGEYFILEQFVFFLICLCTSKLCIWKHCKCDPIPISLCIFSTLMLLLKLI